MLELVLDPRPQRARQRQHGSGAALGRVALVRTRDGDRASLEIDIALAQREQLALAQPERRPAREERTPILGNLLEHARELLRSQRDVDALGHLARLGRRERVLADPAAGSARLREDDVQHRAHLVDARGRGAAFLDSVQQTIEIRVTKTLQRDRARLRSDHVLLETTALDVAARLGAALCKPPIAKIAERAGQVFLRRVEPSGHAQLRAASGLLLQLELRRKCFRFDFRARFGRSLRPAIRTAKPHVPSAAALKDACHGYVPPRVATIAPGFFRGWPLAKA